jgi:2,3,4,5-tetrahydropyridine-2-carboxylate N-succinyltransferase
MTAGETRLREELEALVAAGDDADPQRVAAAVGELIDALEEGRVRAAEPADGAWRVHAWVKQGILLGFRTSEIVGYPDAGPMGFRDKAAFPPRSGRQVGRLRVVPGGTAIRRGAHVADGVVLMPPAYVNVGAHVGPRAMIDSHALVGSCAQIGAGVHLSAGAQIGGVLEPPGAMPVIVEEGAFVGGLSALLEGVRVCRQAVIGAGVILTASTPVYDVPRRRVLRAGSDGVLTIPERAVVVPGSRPLADPWAREQGLAGAAAIVVKDRDEGTQARAALEEALR